MLRRVVCWARTTTVLLLEAACITAAHADRVSFRSSFATDNGAVPMRRLSALALTWEICCLASIVTVGLLVDKHGL